MRLKVTQNGVCRAKSDDLTHILHAEPSIIVHAQDQ